MAVSEVSVVSVAIGIVAGEVVVILLAVTSSCSHVNSIKSNSIVSMFVMRVVREPD